MKSASTYLKPADVNTEHGSGPSQLLVSGFKNVRHALALGFQPVILELLGGVLGAIKCRHNGIPANPPPPSRSPGPGCPGGGWAPSAARDLGQGHSAHVTCCMSRKVSLAGGCVLSSRSFDTLQVWLSCHGALASRLFQNTSLGLVRLIRSLWTV